MRCVVWWEERAVRRGRGAVGSGREGEVGSWRWVLETKAVQIGRASCRERV